MAWTFVRPTDPNVLAGRPLLDLGVGDGQTLAALATGGLIVGLDRSVQALRAARLAGIERLACGAALDLPLLDQTFATVLAGDLVHHLDDDDLPTMLGDVRRVLRPRGRLVAWWYETSAHPSPDAPAHPRSYETVSPIVASMGFDDVESLGLVIELASGPRTVGLTAVRGS